MDIYEKPIRAEIARIQNRLNENMQARRKALKKMESNELKLIGIRQAVKSGNQDISLLDKYKAFQKEDFILLRSVMGYDDHTARNTLTFLNRIVNSGLIKDYQFLLWTRDDAFSWVTKVLYHPETHAVYFLGASHEKEIESNGECQITLDMCGVPIDITINGSTHKISNSGSIPLPI